MSYLWQWNYMELLKSQYSILYLFVQFHSIIDLVWLYHLFHNRHILEKVLNKISCYIVFIIYCSWHIFLLCPPFKFPQRFGIVPPEALNKKTQLHICRIFEKVIFYVIARESVLQDPASFGTVCAAAGGATGPSMSKAR